MLATHDEVGFAWNSSQLMTPQSEVGGQVPEVFATKPQSGARHRQWQHFLRVSVIEDLFIFLLHTQENSNKTGIPSRTGFGSLAWYGESGQQVL